ncbi:MAG: hypothetical protein ACT6FE_08580, partial [Methanosarcinaceae archaeon]
LTLSLPHQPISGVEMGLKNQSLMLHSGADGKFKFENISQQNGWLHYSKNEFHPDSLYIDWTEDKGSFFEIYLNAIPSLDSIIFYSSLINYDWGIQILELYVQAQITDVDNDIDSVFFNSVFLNFNTQLTFDTIDKLFEKKHISMAQLGISSAEELIGHTFNIIVKDHFKRSINIYRTQIQRIIRDEVELKSPISYDTVSTMPTLRWEPVTPGYPFTYSVEIRRGDTDFQLVWSKDNLPSTSLSVEVDVALPTSPISIYKWAVWIIDSFGNRARSKFKTFQVK